MGEGIVVTGRIGSSPRARGSASGQTCPDFLTLEGQTTAVIGEMPEFDMTDEVLDTSERNSDQGYLVVPPVLVYDALASRLRS